MINLNEKTNGENNMKTFYQIKTFYTSTCYDNINVCNQVIIRLIFEGERFDYMDDFIHITRIKNGKRLFLAEYDY